MTVTKEEKCFDKLWLQATINALFKADITCDTLNLLYIKNKNAQIAVKVNGNLTKSILVKEVVMQGNLWAGLKCSTRMDKLNKFMLREEHLKYFYMRYTNITIGVLGMVDDTLSISNCGTISEIPYGPYTIQIGLQLRESILVIGMLFNTEAFSSITNKELVRMEQVD